MCDAVAMCSLSMYIRISLHTYTYTVYRLTFISSVKNISSGRDEQYFVLFRSNSKWSSHSGDKWPKRGVMLW